MRLLAFGDFLGSFARILREAPGCPGRRPHFANVCRRWRRATCIRTPNPDGCACATWTSTSTCVSTDASSKGRPRSCSNASTARPTPSCSTRGGSTSRRPKSRPPVEAGGPWSSRWARPIRFSAPRSGSRWPPTPTGCGCVTRRGPGPPGSSGSRRRRPPGGSIRFCSRNRRRSTPGAGSRSRTPPRSA